VCHWSCDGCRRRDESMAHNFQRQDNMSEIGGAKTNFLDPHCSHALTTTWYRVDLSIGNAAPGQVYRLW
jgi:hypothetical protein